MASSLLWSASQIPDLKGRIIIVTGSDTGIGYEAAHELARHGAHVVVATRDEKKGSECASQTSTPLLVYACIREFGHRPVLCLLHSDEPAACNVMLCVFTASLLKGRAASACRAADTIQKDAPEGKAEFMKLELASFRCEPHACHPSLRRSLRLAAPTMLCYMEPQCKVQTE